MGLYGFRHPSYRETISPVLGSTLSASEASVFADREVRRACFSLIRRFRKRLSPSQPMRPTAGTARLAGQKASRAASANRCVASAPRDFAPWRFWDVCRHWAPTVRLRRRPNTFHISRPREPSILGPYIRPQARDSRCIPLAQGCRTSPCPDRLGERLREGAPPDLDWQETAVRRRRGLLACQRARSPRRRD